MLGFWAGCSAPVNASRPKSRKKNRKNSSSKSPTATPKSCAGVRRGKATRYDIPSEGEAEGLRIRSSGQAKAQETIAKTLTPDYLRFKLYDSQNSKFVLLPDKLDVPVLINPGSDKPAQMTQDPTMRLEDDRSGRYDSNRFHREAGTSVLRPSNASRCPFPSEMPRLSEGLSRERPSLLWNALM